MANKKNQQLNEAWVRRMAGEAYFARGLRYYQDGQVSSLQGQGNAVRAVVSGSHEYAVKLAWGEQRMDHSCDCPLGVDGEFCKHCVATALAWLARSPKKNGKENDELTLAKAEKILLAENPTVLVRTLIAWAQDDDRLRDRVLLYAARRLGPDAAITAAYRAFQKAVETHGFVHYREAAGWASGVDDAIDAIEQLLEEGHAAAVVDLSESGLQDLAGALESLDDSDGYLSGLRDRLQGLHFEACGASRPDPVALAKRLFQYELHSEFDVFYGAAAQYATILGTKGLAAYRKLAEVEWRKVPVRRAAEGARSSDYFKITHVMLALARATGDVDELVGVMSRDLSLAYRYVEIGEVCREAGRFGEALQWAEKGLAAFPERTDGRLREFVAQEYHRLGRHEDAMKLMWAVFTERVCLETYQKLVTHAKQTKRGPAWREDALAAIRAGIAQAKANPNQLQWMRASHSLLVEIFLHEADPEGAWNEATAGGCSDGLWLRLAEAREKDHPAAAALVYFRLAESALVAATNSRYDESVRLLAKAAGVMKRLGRRDEAARQIEAMRLKYKAKRNFGKLLDQKAKALGLR